MTYYQEKEDPDLDTEALDRMFNRAWWLQYADARRAVCGTTARGRIRLAHKDGRRGTHGVIVANLASGEI